MQKHIKTMISVLVVLGIISVGNGHTSDLIDNIEIIAIKSMKVESNILSIDTKMKNSNKERIKLTEGKFTFYLRINKGENENLTEDEKLGTDSTSREIKLETEETLSGDRANDVKFKVNLGEQKTTLNSLKRMLNAIGNPSKTKPIFYIDGKFYLGAESDKGWSSVKAGIEWVFKPDLQRKVLLEASPDIPFPDIEKIIYKDITEDCMAFVKINFAHNSWHLPSGHTLDSYVSVLKNRFPGAMFTIAGHTCELGTPEYNLELSEKRALSVKNYLTRRGVDPGCLDIMAYGETRRIDFTDSEEGREVNRRVEFICKEECCRKN